MKLRRRALKCSSRFCRKKVPIIIVVTGLENEDDMDQWWHDNKPVFDNYNMHRENFASITATEGKIVDGVVFQDEYNKSKEEVAEPISSSYDKVPWKVEGTI